MKFTYEAYEGMIKTLWTSGYEIRNYHNYGQVQKPCIIRHDVDMSLERAVELSEFESQILGSEEIQSTYFILVTSDFYNIFSKRSQELLKRILKGGHEIGLHFDEKRYPWEEIKYHIHREAALLEEVIGEKVQVVSMHRPSQRTLEVDMDLESIINSYDKKFFKDFKYVSDSRMCWREDVEKVIQLGNYQALHILTHPIWYGNREETVRERLMEFLKSAAHERYGYIDENFRDLQEYIKRDAIL